MRARVAAGVIGVLAVAVAAGQVPVVPGVGGGVPKDAAVIELDLPRGATATLDGVRFGADHTLTLEGIEPGAWAERKVVVTLPGGAKVEKPLLLRGGWRVRVPVRADPERPELVLQTGHPGPIRALTLSPDGRLLATADSHVCIIWDAATGRQLRRIMAADPSGFEDLAFSPDGKLLAAAHVQHLACVWDVATGKPVLEWRRGQSDFVSGVRFPAADRVVAWGRSGQEVFASDVSVPEGRATARKVGAMANAAFVRDVSADGRFMLADVTVAGGREAVVWDLTAGKEVARLRGKGFTGFDLLTGRFSPDGSRVAGSGQGPDVAKIYAWDLKVGGDPRTLSLPVLTGFAFTADGTSLVALGEDVRVWDMTTGKDAVAARVNLKLYSTRVALSPDGKRLHAHGFATHEGPDSAEARLDAVDLRAGTATTLFRGRFIAPRQVAFSADGSALGVRASGWNRFGVGVWDLRGGRPAWSRVEGAAELQGLAFLPTGEVGTLIHARNNLVKSFGLLRLDAATGELKSSTTLVSVRADEHLFPKGHFTPDGRRLLAWGGLGYEVWDTAAGKRLRGYAVKEFTENARIAPDGSAVAVEVLAQADETAVEVRNPLNVKLATVSQRNVRPYPLAFDPAGKRLVTPGDPDGFAVWDALTGKLLQKLPNPGAVHALPVAFTPDGRFAVYGRRDNTLAVWDLTAEKLRHVLRGHFAWPTDAVVGPDGRLAATAGDDGTVRLWDLATGDELAALFSFAETDDWLVVTPDGLFDGSAGGRAKVAYRIGGGLNVVPVERFFKDFYRPGLLAELFGGGRPVPAVRLTGQQPPSVRIVSPAGGNVADPAVSLVVHVTDEGGGISDVAVMHAGARIRPAAAEAVDGRTRRLTYAFKLAGGPNRIEVSARTANGVQKGDPAAVTLVYGKPLAKVAVHVLAVGVNEYADESLRLKYAVADAEAVAGLFRQRGKELFSVPHVTTLRNAEATKEAIRAAVAGIAKTAAPEDVLVVFLAGHGAAIDEQRYFFIPADFKSAPGSTREDDIRKQGLAGDELFDWLRTVPATKRVVILDTCHAGAAVGLRDPFAFRGAVEALREANGVHVIGASAAGQKAKEVDDLGHGVLTYALLAGAGAVAGGPLADRPIKPRDPAGVLDVYEWFGYAAREVPALNQKYGQPRQLPAVSGTENVFPLIPPRAK